MSLKVVQVVQEISNAGGVETVADELARVFTRHGLSNVVLASAVGKDLDKTIRIQRVASWLTYIPTRGPFRYIGRAIVVPLFTLAVTRALADHPGAVVISHGDSLKGDVLIVHAVNAQSLAEKRAAGNWRWMLNPMHLWVSLRDRFMIGGLRYQTFVAVSTRVTTELQDIYQVPSSRIRVISNGIDIKRFQADPDSRRSIRREFGIPEDAKLLLFVGHEFARKGLAHAVRALDRLSDDFWLLVVGSDNPASYKKLTERARDRLLFAGTRRDMPALYSAADVFVLPTAYEAFPLVCMEALACSRPVFATPVGGIEEYLRDGVNGFQIKADADDIAAKLTAAFADPELMARMRQGARTTAEHYGWEHIGLQYIELMTQIDTLKQQMNTKVRVLAAEA